MKDIKTTLCTACKIYYEDVDYDDCPLCVAKTDNERLKEAMRAYNRKLAEVWGKEENPYAVAYGWVRLEWEATLAGKDK